MAKEILPKPDGKYWRVRVRRPSQGVNLMERFPTKQEAQDYIDKTVVPLLSKSERPIEANPSHMTFGTFADLYLKQPMMDMTRERELKPSSAAERLVRINVLKDLLGTIKLSRLTPKVLEQKLDSQQWGRQSRQKYEVTLNRMFEWGRTKDAGKLIAANPINGIVRTSGKSRKLKRVYTEREWTTLLEHADEQTVPLGLVLRLLRVTGARKGEVMGLLWDDIQPTDRSDFAARLQFRDTKNREDRATFIKEDMYLLLKAYEQEHRRPDVDQVFNFKIDPVFRKVREEAGLDQPDRNGEFLTVHAVRRTFATALGKRGASLAQMRAVGGWKTAEQAMRYMQTDEDLIAEALKL